jgi:hypothetical protein
MVFVTKLLESGNLIPYYVFYRKRFVLLNLKQMGVGLRKGGLEGGSWTAPKGCRH